MGRVRQQEEDGSGGGRNGSERVIDDDDDGGGFHSVVQPNRDPQSNFELDLAKKLEDYLLKICSGELTSDSDHSINFAEAALLLQGSIQVYSRKVEYLYSLVLQALDFISQKKQDHDDNSSSTRPDKDVHNAVEVEDEDGAFLGLDDVPGDSKINLDEGANRGDTLDIYFVKPPANLLVLEGDCLDTSGGDAGELESYLLSSCNFYGDFLLLDPSDAVAIHEFQKPKDFGKEHNISQRERGSSAKSRRHSGFFSSSEGISRGASHRTSSAKKKHASNLNEFSAANLDFDTDYNNETSGPHVQRDCPDYELHHEDDPYAGDNSDDDSLDSPWKPLNPHEHGNLKIKPFKKGKTFGKKLVYNTEKVIVSREFPLAKLDGTINPEFSELMKLHRRSHESVQEFQSPPLYEKLRQSFIFEEPKTVGDIYHDNNETEFEENPPDSDIDNYEIPQCDYHVDAANFGAEKEGEGTSKFDDDKSVNHDDLDHDANLEDLCRSHMDLLLASIAENEKQTELATRVSSWKQRIEHTLEEEDSQPPFDIHRYGEKVLQKLSTSGDGGNMCFTDVVMGEKQHEIARTFSAVLQLVNNGNVDLEKMQPNKESFCYTAETPFHVRLVDPDGRGVKTCASLLKKRAKSPSRHGASVLKSPNKNGDPSLSLEKGIPTRCSPRKKRRRRSPSSRRRAGPQPIM